MRLTRKYLRILTAASALYIGLAAAGCSNTDGKLRQSAVAESPQKSGSAVKIEEGGALEIPVSEISEDASFYTIDVNGTQMEIIAVKDQNGTIRTAFNTCQICYSSGRGYYKQAGDYLVCQNCGNRFTADQVETSSGGCNPWPIFAENKTADDNYISISYDFLDESRRIFANWKSTY